MTEDKGKNPARVRAGRIGGLRTAERGSAYMRQIGAIGGSKAHHITWQEKLAKGWALSKPKEDGQRAARTKRTGRGTRESGGG